MDSLRLGLDQYPGPDLILVRDPGRPLKFALLEGNTFHCACLFIGSF